MKKIWIGFFVVLAIVCNGCGPHHVTTTTVMVTKYECVNWIQTISLCDTLDECNRVCKEAREKP